MWVALVQFDIAWEDKPANHATIERMLIEAGVEPGAYVLLPELGDTGFSFNLDAIIDEQTLTWATELAERKRIWLQPGFAERSDDGKGRNCAAIISPTGEVLGIYRKVHPFSYGKEAEHYTGGDELLIRSCGGTAVCPMICYDLRFPELWRIAATAGAELYTTAANWPDARQSHWRALLIARAIENQAFVVGVNRVGSDPHLHYVGGSIIVSPKGDVVAEAGCEPIVLTAQLDLDALRRWRGQFPALRDLHRELLGAIPVDASPP
ncbi:MAG: carbon-nitrogen family hydrolase [Planctomycetes bacterium]|nr:carbon-nitrogen family hydrolase [Planctomycetota bacterium]